MDENTYTTKDIAAIYKVSHQAVKTWAREFAAYLSPAARPEEGKRRIFSDDDVRVFALVRDLTQRGYNFADAHLALKAGQRGDVPDTASEIAVTPPAALVVALRENITNLQLLLRNAESERDQERGQVRLLKEQLTEKENELREQYKLAARYEAKFGKLEE
jgi:DNA-binding transcriptional MerR regulator